MPGPCKRCGRWPQSWWDWQHHFVKVELTAPWRDPIEVFCRVCFEQKAQDHCPQCHHRLD